MKYTITGVKKEVKAKKDGSGTWTKILVKTDKTGDEIWELGNGHSKYFKDNIAKGNVVTGYTEKAPWTKSDGTLGGYNNKLNGVTVEYLYDMLLKAFPDFESLANANTQTTVETTEEAVEEETETTPDW